MLDKPRRNGRLDPWARAMDDDRREDAATDQSSFLVDAPLPAPASGHVVLARKYRPSSFDDLIGQDAMVRTLRNAFRMGRIHQAYLLTGVRGVGKTTTARILARALNYRLPARDGRPPVDGPTIEMPELGVHCQAIIESRHIDVIEMDAASNTGVDDVREIIENARFRPVSARTKVYIVDEVHMLTKQAFNALLKTLEEPPDHVRFIFATTEVEKVPITVRSRCQRFDLRRVSSDLMTRRLARICELEGVPIEDEALALIARAAEGSVRDALSILDQAIAHGGDAIDAASVNAMMGLADRGRIVDLFELLMRGEASTALKSFRDLCDLGADPGQLLVELAEFTHYVTGLKVASGEDFVAATPEERRRGLAMSAALNLANLTRAWQILMRGVQDVKESPRPLAAADMVLVRLAYAADLPTPDEALRRLRSAAAEDGGRRSAPPPAASPSPPPSSNPGAAASRILRAAPAPVAEPSPATVAPERRIRGFEDIVAQARFERDIKLTAALERDVRLVAFDQGSIEFSLAPGASPQIAQELARKLLDWTGERWMVALSTQEGAPSLRELEARQDQERRSGVRSEPLVRAVLEAFPGAEIVAVNGMDDRIRGEGALDEAAQPDEADEA